MFKITESAMAMVSKVREKCPNFNGKTLTKQEITHMEQALDLKFPEWYVELFTTVPLVGLVLDLDIVGKIVFCDYEEIVEECTSYIPGSFILDNGYICFANPLSHSGDPCFISLNEGENPPVYMVFHEVIENDETEELDFEKLLLAERLTSLFEKAMT